jgi:hypothetical protein
MACATQARISFSRDPLAGRYGTGAALTPVSDKRSLPSAAKHGTAKPDFTARRLM